jgi:hypothetical protein
MTEVSYEGDIVQRPRETQWSHYPLPPETGRFKPTYNYLKQYTLPHPDTGRATSFSRATTIAGVLDDRYNLEKWIQRKLVAAVLDGVRVQMKLANPLTEFAGVSDHEKAIDAAMIHLWGTDVSARKLNEAVDYLDNLQGGSDATEFGTAVHAWCEAIDMNIVQMCEVPDVFTEHVRAYREIVLRHALYPVPIYTERIVLNDGESETIVGTLDRLFRVITTGALVLGDVKTTKAESLDYGILEFCVQLAVYRFARLMLSLDGSRWETMPVLASDTAYLIHVPNDDHRRAACIALDTGFGSAGLRLALTVRDMRRRAKRQGLIGVIPIPSREALQWAQARHDIQDINHPEELTGIWEKYREVWTEDLTALGQQIADLINEGELVQ